MPGLVSAASRWQVILDEFRQSGMKQAEFCRERQLSLQTFRKYLYGSRPVKKVASGVTFLPVATPTSLLNTPQGNSDAITLILGKGRRVAVAPGFDPPTLQRVIETIEGLA